MQKEDSDVIAIPWGVAKHLYKSEWVDDDGAKAYLSGVKLALAKYHDEMPVQRAPAKPAEEYPPYERYLFAFYYQENWTHDEINDNKDNLQTLGFVSRELALEKYEEWGNGEPAVLWDMTDRVIVWRSWDQYGF